MKIKRQSKVKKILNFYKHNFGHHPPYQMLIDGTFTQACLKVSNEKFRQNDQISYQKTKYLDTE